MASDAKVRELTALYSLRSNLLSVSGALRNSLSQAAQCVHSEESELIGFLGQIESRRNQCRDELYYAEREYDEYCNCTDPERYSAYEAEALRNNVEKARQCLQQAEQNLDLARGLVEQGRQVLSGIQGLASSAASSIDADSSQIASAIEHAAFEIDKYANH